MTRAARIIPTHTPRGISIGPRNTSFGRSVVLVNPGDADWTKHRFVLWFGAVGTTRLMVWANGIEVALEECGDWIADHAPGLLCDEQVKEAFEEALAEGACTDDAWEHALEDTTPLDNGHYLLSYKWGIDLEDPTRAQLDAYLYPPDIIWHERTHCAGASFIQCYPTRYPPRASRAPCAEGGSP